MKKFKKFFSAVMLAGILTGTVAYGEESALYSDFDFNLPLNGTAYSKVVKKQTTNTYALVERKYPVGSQTTVKFTVVNKDGYTKSATTEITGNNSKKVFYGGYTVDKGDDVKLRGQNMPDNHIGETISATGAWCP